jgi:ribonuclease BN (tRNA processing enzyme)
MKMHFLGTNGWHDSETGETPCILIDSREAYVVLDAGNAFRKIDRHIKDPKKPIFLFLSHFHLDHISGLHMLMKFDFPQGMHIYGQPGTEKILEIFLASPFTASAEAVRKKYPLEISDLAEGDNSVHGLKIKTRFLVHADPCFGYSFLLEGKKVTYCTDTGACDAMTELAEGSDVLITECAWRKRKESEWPHLAPEDAAEAAKKSGSKKLILVHFDAVNYPDAMERKNAESRARKIFPETLAANDDLVLDVP